MPEAQDTPNWPEVVAKINAAMSLQAIGNACGLSLQAIHDLKSGRSPEPRYGAGQTLLRLYRRELAKDARAAAKPARKQA